MFQVVLQVRQTELDNDKGRVGARFIRSNDETAPSQNLRIFIYYDNSSIDQLPTEAQRDYVRERLVPQAVDYWQQALSLRHPSDIRIRLNR